MGLLDPQALEYFGLLGQSMLAGQSPNAGVNIGNAMMYADTEMRRKAAERARLEEERQQAKMRDMAMQKALREQEAQDYMGRGIQQFMRPPQAATQQFGPGDMETPSQLTPARPGGFDQGGFAQYLAQNPATAQQALQFMPKPREPFKLNKNERLIDPTTNKPIVDAVEEGIKKGTTRVIESGRVKFTYEWDGGQWKQIAKSSMDKPEGEAKPHYDPTLGGYVYPPKPGQAPSFVPIPGAPKKPGKAPPEAYLKQQAGVQNVTSALSEYVKALDGFSVSDLARPDKRAALGTVYNNALLQAKEAYNLGVLNGPDYAILQEVLTNPMSWKGAVTSNEAMKAQANKMTELMRKVGEGAAAAHGISAPEGDQSDPLGLRK